MAIDTKKPATPAPAAPTGAKSSLQSPVTTDMPNKPKAASDMSEVDLSKVKVEVPSSAITAPAPAATSKLSVEEEGLLTANDKSYETRAMDASIGLIRVDGIDFRYIGIAPARDKDPKTPGGYPITTDNSTFTPLANVAFHPSVRIKDPSSGEFYYPADGITSYDHAELKGSYLIPREANSAASKARKAALIDAKTR